MYLQGFHDLMMLSWYQYSLTTRQDSTVVISAGFGGRVPGSSPDSDA